MLCGALEIILVGKHRQARGAPGLVASRDRRRIEIFSEQALRWARTLDFGNDRRTPGRDSRLKRPDEIARPRLRARAALDLLERNRAPRGLNLLALRGENSFEDIRHARQRFARNWFVKATNSSSLAFASPLAITLRARSI